MSLTRRPQAAGHARQTEVAQVSAAGGRQVSAAASARASRRRPAWPSVTPAIVAPL
ncbi:MAG TPA: hypothetical protein VNK92_02205 [Vicinamibacterales bacterium]|nr:hypothetical protein [Vicinamibacterales bacterium]